MSSGRFIVELAEHTWAELSAQERAVFDEWLKAARGEDLYMLLRHCRRMWRRTRTSSTTLEAITLTTKPSNERED